MTKKCFYCNDTLTEAHFLLGKATMIGQQRYAHTDCIDSHGKENMMDDQTQHILGAADSAHQGIELARSLLQESLGNMGEILTYGCERLGIASLGSAMRLGQQLKEAAFRLGDLRGDAHGLCVLLGKDLGVCEKESSKEWHTLPPVGERPEGLSCRDNFDFSEWSEKAERHGDELGCYCSPDTPEPTPGEDEYRADEKPF